MTVRVAINGFGRTGRGCYRAILQRRLNIDVVAINDIGSAESLARLLARDSVHGALGIDVKAADQELLVGSAVVPILTEAEPSGLPWASLGVDVVIEATGRLTTREKAAAHLAAGASRVVVSAPCKEADGTFVMGVNEDTFDPAKHWIVSNASCTTNCLVPMIKVLDDAFGVEHGFMTTIHAYTGDQQLVDGLHKDPRRARAAALNIVPTSTGAARATGLVIQSMGGRLDGVAVRVPVADGSLTDLVAVVGQDVNVDTVNEAFRSAAGSGRLAHVLDYSDEGLVSTDVIGSTASCVFDAPLTMAAANLVKVFGWYDNESGYANRLVELVALVGSAD